jgi:hypothetical protein
MEKTKTTKFYSFNQNNSGGSFSNSDKEGISEYVIIEALNAENANNKAEELGIYFNGCDDGRDCDCCGDRWYRVDESDADKVASIYGEPIEKANKSMFRNYVFVHYIDGTFKKFEIKECS